MQRKIVRVEVNLLNKKAKMKAKKRGVVKEEPSSSLDRKLDVMMKTMEKIMEILTLENQFIVREPQAPPQIINPNF